MSSSLTRGATYVRPGAYVERSRAQFNSIAAAGGACRSNRGPFRFGLSFVCSLIAVMAVQAQPSQADLPSYLRGAWTKRKVSFGERNATIRLPDGWSIREGGISVSDAEKSDCRIDFALRSGNFEQRLADKLAEDRRISRYAMHSELFHAGGVRVVSVRYPNETGRFVEKRYFELPSDEGSALLEWILNAQSTNEGNDCARRFSVVTGSFCLISSR